MGARSGGKGLEMEDGLVEEGAFFNGYFATISPELIEAHGGTEETSLAGPDDNRALVVGSFGALVPAPAATFLSMM